MSYCQPTLKELARELNLCISTVSRALQNHPSIGHRTRERVHALAEAKNYLPNTAAIGLRTQRKHLVGVVVPAIGLPRMSDWVGEVIQSLFNRGYLAVVCQWAQPQQQPKLVIQTLMSHRVDGVLLLGTAITEPATMLMMNELNKKEIPTVCVDNTVSPLPLWINAHQATESLLAIIEG